MQKLPAIPVELFFFAKIPIVCAVCNCYVIGTYVVLKLCKSGEEYLTAMHIPFTMQKPRPGLTKWKADYWAKVTGWKGRTSEHARDAALLVLGR